MERCPWSTVDRPAIVSCLCDMALNTLKTPLLQAERSEMWAGKVSGGGGADGRVGDRMWPCGSPAMCGERRSQVL